MTLCIVWRTKDNVCFASDSRLSFGKITCDAGIKICRVPFSIYEPDEPDGVPPVVMSGDLGMCFAGSSVVALMMKEALAEVVRDLQGVPGYHDFGMDGISDVMFRGFKVTSQNISAAIFEGAATCVVFAGYCFATKRIRAFQMQLDRANNASINEILGQVGDVEVFGSGEHAARKILPPNPTSKEIVQVLRNVIDDIGTGDVGGSLQYGDFNGMHFQPAGIAMLGESPKGVHYWRGPLDLNGDEFDQARGLIPRFPWLDMI